MAITIPVQAVPRSGPRPVNLNRDVPQILRLLELVFGKALGRDGQRLFAGDLGLDGQPALLWRLSPGVSKLAMGYVWEEDGRIVGNATVLNTKTIGRYLVVNVAVHPDWRRQGIARGLMNQVTTLVNRRGGREILLQVEADNEAALALYRSLGYSEIGSVSTWRATVSALRELPLLDEEGESASIRELHRREWQAAYELDLRALPPDLNWPETLPPDIYRGGLWRWLDRAFNGRRTETWVIDDEDHRLLGLTGIRSEWAHPHMVHVRVDPEWQGLLERPLLAKAVRRLRYLPRRNVRLDHPADDDQMEPLLREANFRKGRTLTHMRWIL